MIVEDTITICVRDLGLMEGHPLRPESSASLIKVPRCHFIFERVSGSCRTLTPYVGDPKQGKFGETVREIDGPFPHRAFAREYAFEGRFDQPLAWVDWVVKAEAFLLEVL